MTNKFQDRLVGAMLLVVFRVIVLLSLLYSDQKNYENKSPAISLILKPDNKQCITIIDDPLIMTVKTGMISEIIRSESMSDMKEISVNSTAYSIPNILGLFI
ncbi:Cell division protein DedD [Candidatus Hartigia pinicola]|nr:Cell division protein DedD [Candidatus Hartigia pinicola]